MLAPARALPRRLPAQPDAELLRRRARRPRRLRDQPGAAVAAAADAGPRQRGARTRRPSRVPVDGEGNRSNSRGLGCERGRHEQDSGSLRRGAETMVAVRRDDFRVAGTVLEAMPSGAPRRLPEHTQYRDTGCDLHPSCLTCPLVRCRYDEPGGARRLLSDERDRTILQAAAAGPHVDSHRAPLRRVAAHRVPRAGAGADAGMPVDGEAESGCRRSDDAADLTDNRRWSSSSRGWTGRGCGPTATTWPSTAASSGRRRSAAASGASSSTTPRRSSTRRRRT